MLPTLRLFIELSVFQGSGCETAGETDTIGPVDDRFTMIYSDM